MNNIITTKLFATRKNIIFTLSIFTALYWFITSNIIDVYKYALVGAICEILWLPCLLALIALPIYAVYFWAKEKFRLKSLYLLSILIIAAIGIFIAFIKN